MDWRDLLFCASDDIHDCIRISRDDLAMEYADRRLAIDTAIELLQEAKAKLPQPVVMKGRL